MKSGNRQLIADAMVRKVREELLRDFGFKLHGQEYSKAYESFVTSNEKQEDIYYQVLYRLMSKHNLEV